MKRIILITSALVFFRLAQAQEDAIITDRPTQSASAFVTPKGALLLEAGFLSEKVRNGVTNLTYLNALVRWGLIEGVEVRLIQNYFGLKILNTTASGLSPLTLGTKVHLLNEEGIRPQMSVLGQITLRTGDDNFKPRSSITEVRLNFQNTLTDIFTLGYNIGFTNSDTDFFYSMVLGAGLGNGFSAFIEPYGFFGDDSDQRYNAGLIYLAQKNLQFDLSFGAGLVDISPDSFIGFGVAYGFN